jgi:prepilin-type N-terminal cleavage/methylation domain-containing protein
MKISQGFTLAEVLITLTIVGLIAALTLPTLNANIQKNTVGPSLAKGINTLENANRLALQDNEVSTLSSITGGYPDGLATYLNGTYYRVGYCNATGEVDPSAVGTGREDSTWSSSSPTTWGSNSGNATGKAASLNLEDATAKKVAGTDYIITQDGIIYEFEDDTTTVSNAPSKYYGNYYTVTIDINGDKNPNTVGHDRFKVIVDLYGSVIPVGGRQYADYTGSSTVNWETTCAANTTPTNYADCAGAIVDNSYKVMYKYN